MSEISNTDLFLYCLWRLGAAGRYVEIEDVFLKAFEVAPSRFSWRTRPIASDKIADQALRDAQKKYDKRLILTSKERNGVQLTAQGVEWVQRRLKQIEVAVGEGAHAGHERPSQRRLVALEGNQLVRAYAEGADVTPSRLQFANLLRLAPDADSRAWRERMETYKAAAQLAKRQQVLRFFERLEIEHPDWFQVTA